ncbi:condensin complex subunit 2 isoform X1 [Ipomoea triloba]|uniref:condensin complex subunit 2 isoform X1 n=1 Tax=Ipomoea triloba TaxID=35885 RepID=UPI00125D39F4|nr:condensin complex subunit 2 isoform X1 [Ipomoea triloba]
MAETLSPNPKLRAPFSPTSPFFLGSNDDNIERAQARAARAAAIRRKPVVAAPPPAASSCLDKKQIFELFQNCIKLASENKINQKNTWELGLIDHLRDIIKAEEENDAETNFQKASCTLEAGVKIYSMRVDSVHSEAYKVLGGINRVGQENEQDPVVEDANIDNEQSGDNPKKEQSRKLSPLSTLESSFEALNVKKFDVAFVVDPLYHQTSAQFDEGGAKGLLLNNLGVYGFCRVLFDSLEVPGKCTPTAVQSEGSEVIDLSFAKDCIDEMVLNMPKKDEISPSIRHIIHQFDEDACRLSETYVSAQNSTEQDFDTIDHAPEADNDVYDNYGAWAMDNDDETSVADQATYEVDQSEPGQQEDGEPLNYRDAEMDDKPDQVDDYLFLSLGFSSKQNLWAGPDHWKYRKVKVPDVPAKEEGSPPKNKKTKSKKAECDIDFTKALDTDLSHIFDPPKNPKSLLLPVNRAPSNRLLPEDCHYQPEDLVKLFLLPNIMCLGRRSRKRTEEASQLRDDCGAMPSWDDDCGFDGTFDDGSVCSDVEDPSTLVSQPRQVNKIDIHYDKTSKQVDVQVLKETLWDQIQGLNQTSVQLQDESVSFKQVLATFPDDCRATGSHDDISPHLCFICLLHLANEHGLCIQGSVNLDDLRIKIAAHNSSVQDAAI